MKYILRCMMYNDPNNKDRCFEDEYDLVKHVLPFIPELHKAAGQLIRERYQHQQVDSIAVLEIGSGTGLTTTELLKADDRIMITAIDHSSTNIEIASLALASYLKDGRLRFCCRDAQEIVEEFSGESFDVVASAMTIHHFDVNKRPQFFHNVFRIIRNGGLFINADKIAHDDEAIHQRELEWEMRQFADRLPNDRKDLKQAWKEHYHEDDLPTRRVNESTATDELLTVGFENVFLSHRRHMEVIIRGVKSKD